MEAAPLRITPVYQLDTLSTTITASARAHIRDTIMPVAVKFFKRVFKVREGRAGPAISQSGWLCICLAVRLVYLSCSSFRTYIYIYSFFFSLRPLARPRASSTFPGPALRS